mgnify:CR=1 FL=1
MLPRLSRLERIIGTECVESFSKKCVLVLGVGGVGGYVVEGLARSGVGKLIIVDFDTVDESNINRQIIALGSTIGRLKVDVLEERIKDINPDCVVVKNSNFIDENNFKEMIKNKFSSFVIEKSFQIP